MVFSFFRCLRKIMAVYVTREQSSPNINCCTLYAANCVLSPCFVLHLCLFVCLCLLFITAQIFSLSVFCVHLFITTLISNYFSPLPSHSARLAFAVSKWLYPPFFHNYFLLLKDSTLLYQEHNTVVVWLLLLCSSLKYTDSLMKIFRLKDLVYMEWGTPV